MGLGDAYQDSTDRTLAVMTSAPLEPEKPAKKWSGWSTIPRAVAGAFTETAGNILDTASAFGQVAAAAGGVGPGFDPDARKNRTQAVEAMDRLKTDGIDWRPEISRPQYEFARDMRPDPLTAGVAENIVFGVTKGLTKAIGAGMLTGPYAGAAAFGLSEGMTASEDLAAEGVDLATRTKVGVVTGGLTAAGAALPVAGQTIRGTIGLAVAGGPASFIAQQAATRTILENADYGELAQQYDPLDPVGLAISTLIPAGFGAWALRGKIRAGRAPVEQVDAAMAHNNTVRQDSHEAITQRLLETGDHEAVAKEFGIPADDLRTRYPAESLPVAEPETVAGIPAADVAAPVDDGARVDSLVARVEAMREASPDMPVALREDGTPARLAEELDAIRRQAQEGTDEELGALDADLLRVAAECALTVGA